MLELQPNSCIFVVSHSLLLLSHEDFLIFEPESHQTKGYIFSPKNFIIRWSRTVMHSGRQVMKKKIEIVMRDIL